MSSTDSPNDSKRGGPHMVCAAAATGIAAVALVGWVFGVESLKSVFPGLTAMNPLTALLFLTAGLALALPRGQALILPAGLLLGLMGLFRMISYAGWDLGLDTLMFRHALGAYSPSNRMAPNTSFGFLMTGLALVFFKRRQSPWSAKAGQSLALAATWLALFAMLGYSYQVPRFYGIGSFIPMALNTAICFALINSAMLLARRGEGWMACLSDDGPGGIMARRLLPFTLMIPALLGFLRLQGQWSGWYNTETGTALFAIALIAAFSGLVWYNALLLGRVDLARRASERERNRYARFFSLSVDMFCIADFNGYFKELSDMWETVLGHPKEEMLQRPYLDFIHPEDRRKTSMEAAQNAQGVRTLSFENRYRCKDGSYKWLLWAAKPVTEERLIYIVARDITQRKEAEDTLRHYAAKLEQSNHELDAFSYSVSHDLRSPLRTIDGFSQVMLEDYTDRLDDQGKDCLNRIRQGCQQMGRLIDDLINLSRVIRHEFRVEETDLSAVAGSVMEEFKNADRSREVAFALPAGVSVRGDPGLLRAALENLLGNAWKFTGKKKDAKIEFGVLRKNGEAIYFVKDNGAGFDMAYANKLFGAFQRLHSQEEFAGTGIGLATTQRIVHRHGGRIWAEGAIDQGAAFYFTLNSKGDSDGNK